MHNRNRIFEVFAIDENRFSLKDLSGRINLAKSSLDGLFTCIIDDAANVYFIGNRLDFLPPDLEIMVNGLADQQIRLSPKQDYSHIAFKVKLSDILVSRSRLNELWECYEYPTLIFVKDKLNSYEFSRLFDAKYNEDFFVFLESFVIVYKSFELDVLWVEKTIDLKLPPIQQLFFQNEE